LEGDRCGPGIPEAVRRGLVAGLERQLDKLAGSSLDPGLYVVSTPIGNLGDISVRALFTLLAADLVLCEDTRHSRKLFSAYGIHNKLLAYHDFSGDKDRNRVLAALAAGKRVALISDAGTPLIADPGFKLVREAISQGFQVRAIPGPSAILTALVSSGLPTDRFFFEGFLPAKESAKREEIENIRNIPGTIVLYETGARLRSTLRTLGEAYPDRQLSVARELTKLHETIRRGSPAQVLEDLSDQETLGEFVLLIGPGSAAAPTDDDVEAALRKAMRAGTLREAVDEVTKGLGAGKKNVYNLALKIRDEDK
jgi:16S rRNA (cytidine1402-2'-O)-methyltransferase